MKELLEARRTPVLFSCRRQADGGEWEGTEEQRVIFLRQAVLAGADYVAVEHDVAALVKSYDGKTKRVICYTNSQETPANIAEICDGFCEHNPDVIQVTCKANLPEDAWPLMKLLANPPAPLVVVGLGWPGIMLALLGKRYGAPWVSAAAERGMEDYVGQPTVRELLDVYRYEEISRQTEWVGVTGVGDWEVLTIALLNAAFAAKGSQKRCLPVQVGDATRFRKFAERLKFAGIVIAPDDQAALRPIANELDENVTFPSWATQSEPVEAAVDVLVPMDEKQWKGGSVFPRSALSALKAKMIEHGKDLDGAVVIFVGLTPALLNLAHGVKKRGAVVIFADTDQEAALRHARWFGGRHMRPEGIYSALFDVLIVCRELYADPLHESREVVLRPICLKAGMTVMDLTGLPLRTDFLRAALDRGCVVVEPIEILYRYVQRLAYRLRSIDVPRSVLQQAINGLIADALLSVTDYPVLSTAGPGPGADDAQDKD